MGWFSRVVLLGCLVSSTCGLRALDFQYGSLFNVKGITFKNDLPVLPLSHKQYADVRVLDKETFALLRNCKDSCNQSAADGVVRLGRIRPAQTRPGMWIAEVAVDEKWLLTFLVFKEGEAIRIVSPGGVEFLNALWLNRVHSLLQAQVCSGGEET